VPRLNHFVSAIVSVVSVTILPNVTLAESPAKEPVNIVAITKPAVIQSLTIEDDIEFDFEDCRQNVQTREEYFIRKTVASIESELLLGSTTALAKTG
jgi:ATP-dependent phosphoenolpyruvate carboxykinase